MGVAEGLRVRGVGMLKQTKSIFFFHLKCAVKDMVLFRIRYDYQSRKLKMPRNTLKYPTTGYWLSYVPIPLPSLTHIACCVWMEN